LFSDNVLESKESWPIEDPARREGAGSGFTPQGCSLSQMDQVKFQITNIKYQTNNNDQNSKFQTLDLEEEKSNLFRSLDIGI